MTSVEIKIMNNDPKKIISELLEIIGYTDDKESYVNSFIEICYQKALLDLIVKLSEEKQQQLNQRLSLTPVDEKRKLYEEYFPKEEIDEAIENAGKETFEEFIKSVEPTLNDDQRNKLGDYLNSLSPQPVSAKIICRIFVLTQI